VDPIGLHPPPQLYQLKKKQVQNYTILGIQMAMIRNNYRINRNFLKIVLKFSVGDNKREDKVL
jgi:hypothetical protein